MTMQSTNTIIVGASAAGLAVAACLQKAGVAYVILEKYPHVAHQWRNHYDRLHLHTAKANSGLPYMPYDVSLPKYPAREDVVAYLEKYAETMDIHPVFNTEVRWAQRDNGQWLVEATDGRTWQAPNLIMATGAARTPTVPRFEGIETFPGPVLHASQYKNGKPFAGQQVLVVGFGNSGCEQAICLHEHGAHPAMSVRSAVNVIPRDVFGFSILQLGLTMKSLPPRFVDKMNAPLLNFLVGDITKLGLKKAPIGPVEQIVTTGRIPLLDIGTIKLMREGHIKVFGDVDRIAGKTVFFKDGKSADFDAIILATGYKHDLEKMMRLDADTLEDLKKPMSKRGTNGKDGLYFCGIYISPNGMLREMGIEAKLVAEQIKK